MPVYTASKDPGATKRIAGDYFLCQATVRLPMFAKGQSGDTDAIAAISSSLVLAELFSARLFKQAEAPEHANHHVIRCLH